MPTPPNVPNVIRSRFSGTLSTGSDWSIHLYWSYTGSAPNNTEMLTFADALSTAWSGNLAALQSSTVEMNEVDVEDLSVSGAAATYPFPVPGTVTESSPVPDQVCFVMKFAINRRYRGGKPKIFFPGIQVANQQDAATWSSAAITEWEESWGSFIDAVDGTGIGPATIVDNVSVSYYEGFTSVQNPITLRWRNVPKYREVPLVDIVQEYSVDPRLGSQKRRRSSTAP